MKTITKEYQVFNFNELSNEAKEKAVNDDINYFLECTPYEDMEGKYKKAIDKAEAMQTPWFTGSYIYEYCKKDIEKNLKEELFFKDGSIFIE